MDRARPGEFQGEEWARGETARLTEIHAACVDDYVEQLIRAHRATMPSLLRKARSGNTPTVIGRGPPDPSPCARRPPGRCPASLPDLPITASRGVGTEPSPEVVQIECRVAIGWDGIDPERQVPAPIGVFEVPLPASLAHRVAFVGRSDEQEVLRTQLALVGSPGSGASWWWRGRDRQVEGREGPNARRPNDRRIDARWVQYWPLITKYEPRMVPASFDFWRANLNELNSEGTSIPSESLNPTARFGSGPSSV